MFTFRRTLSVSLSALCYNFINGRFHDRLYGLVGFLFADSVNGQFIRIMADEVIVVW
jgi:hypothetical protein